MTSPRTVLWLTVLMLAACSSSGAGVAPAEDAAPSVADSTRPKLGGGTDAAYAPDEWASPGIEAGLGSSVEPPMDALDSARGVDAYMPPADATWMDPEAGIYYGITRGDAGSWCDCGYNGKCIMGGEKIVVNCVTYTCGGGNLWSECPGCDQANPPCKDGGRGN